MTETIKEARSLRTPMVLLPYQQRWMADTSPVKVVEKSRRTGFSWGEAADDSLLASSTHGMDVFYVGYNKDMAQEFIEDCADWAKFYNMASSSVEEFVFDDEDKDILAFRVRFASGYKIVALSSRPSNLRGKQGKIVIDEAAFHPELAELLKAALAMLMWGGRVVVISTHNGDANPFNEYITDIRAGKKPYSLHRVTLDDAMQEGLFQRICLRTGKPWSPEAEAAWRDDLVTNYGDGADEELFCIPRSGSGVFFSRGLIEGCMSDDIPVVRLKCRTEFEQESEQARRSVIEQWCEQKLEPLLARLEKHAPSYFGEDFGRSGDLTVIWPLQESGKLKCRTPFTVELRNVPFRQQEQILFYLVDRLPNFRAGAMDARGNGQALAEYAMQRYGENRIARVMLSAEWYRDNMPRYKSAFEDTEIEIPKDGDILDDHRAVVMEKGVPRVPEADRGKGRDGLQRHGDSAIAGCMAWHAAKVMDTGPAEPVGCPSGAPRESAAMFKNF